ncbi:uncharacterized protein LOC131614989 [Vicia villosa]|uniref:uncharacterized protein LOC131614989 n=1 Tax=Vicia villosa TaxID=3911 RepID=UPI00273B8998|nr:uncharacterized protein LOC131614989 [Vicia villosa]
MVSKRKFSMTQVYHCLIQENTATDWHHLMFHNIARPRAKLSMWLCCHGRMATKERLYKFGLLQDTRYELCGHEVETLDHILFNCKYSTVIWTGICNWMHLTGRIINLNWIKTWTHGKGWRKRLFKVVAAETICAIWTQRNNYIFQKDSYTIDSDRNIKKYS